MSVTRRARSLRVRRAALAGLFAGVLAVGGGVAAPATALGALGKTCSSGFSLNGSSTSTRATSATPGVSYCGYARVRAFYQAYPGSPVYYTSWSQSSGTAIAQPGNTLLGGNHDCTDPAPAYSGNFPFST